MDHDEYIQQEIKKMEEEQWNSFLPRVTEIQKALKPLGYIVNGCFEKGFSNLEIHLFRASRFICIKEPDVVNPDVSGGDRNEKEEA